jgi:hypothetical protein
VNRPRYEGYVATRDAIAVLELDPFAAEVVADLAEALLLARDESEAAAARDRVPRFLAMLVDEGNLTRRSANLFWVHMRACAPRMLWPASWDRSAASAYGSPPARLRD